MKCDEFCKKHGIDVGCGSVPIGFVNIDINFDANVHHKFRYNVREKKYNNFVLASGEFLPIRNKSMPMVFCSHMIEHCINPIEIMKEFKRVSTKWVVIVTPNKPIFTEHRAHYYSWSLSSLKNFLLLFFPNVIVAGQTRRYQFLKSPIIRMLVKLSVIKKPLTRWLSIKLDLEIKAICITEKKA